MLAWSDCLSNDTKQMEMASGDDNKAEKIKLRTEQTQAKEKHSVQWSRFTSEKKHQL